MSGHTLARDSRGGTGFVELLILVALVAIGALVGVRALGESVRDKFIGDPVVAGGGSVSDVVLPSASPRMGPRAPVLAKTSAIPVSDITVVAPGGGTLAQGYMPGESAGIPDAVSDRFSPGAVWSAIRRTAGDAVRGAVAGALDPDPTIAGVFGQVAVGVTPLGIAGDLRDIGVSTGRVANGTGSVFDVVLDAAGLFPVLGDFAKGAIGLAVARRADGPPRSSRIRAGEEMLAGATSADEVRSILNANGFQRIADPSKDFEVFISEAHDFVVKIPRRGGEAGTAYARRNLDWIDQLRRDPELAQLLPDGTVHPSGIVIQERAQGLDFKELENISEAAEDAAMSAVDDIVASAQTIAPDLPIDASYLNFKYDPDTYRPVAWFDPVSDQIPR